MNKPITKQKIEELQQQNHSVQLIDIRTAEEYEKMHVPGAVNIPAEAIKENSKNFDANDVIVCICNKGLERGQQAAETFTALGFTNVFYLEGGTFGW